MAIVADEETIDKLRNILFEMIKTAKLKASMQKIYLKAMDERELGVYIFRISNVSPRIRVSNNSVDYVAIIEDVDADLQEPLARILREQGIIVSLKNNVDISIFVDKAPSVVGIDENRGKISIVARLLNDISRLLSLRRDVVLKIIKTVIKDESEELIEAYRLVTRR